MDLAAEQGKGGRRPLGGALVAGGVCAVLLALFAVISFRAASHKCATFDEPLHLVSAWMALHDGDFRCDVEDPPLWKYWSVAGTHASDMHIDLKGEEASALLSQRDAEFDFTADTLYNRRNDADALLTAARARMLVLAVALGALIGLWAWRLAGPLAAFAASLLFCFDPNFMAHAALVKNDVAISLAILLLFFFVWLVGRRITPLRLLAVGVCLGAALNTKFSGVLMIPVLAMLLLVRAMLAQPWPAMRWQLLLRRERLAGAGVIFLAAIVIAWAGTWACYRGQVPLRAASGLNSPFQGAQAISSLAVRDLKQRGLKPDATFRTLVAIQRRHLLPQAYLAGLIVTYASSIVRPAFLLGEIYFEGSWCYFPLAMAFKTPLATLAAMFLALAVLLRPGHLPRFSVVWRDAWTAMCLALPPAFYMVWAMQSALNLGLRHVLLVYPFAFIGVGVFAAWAWRNHRLATALVAPCLALGLVIENLSAYPDYIPFFNVAAGGERGGLGLLSDSNLDWGQDLPALADWQRQHGEVPLLLCYFGSADPKYYGIRYVNVLGSDAGPDLPSAPPGQAMLAISATHLQRTYLPQYSSEISAAVRGQPAAVLGGSIYLFPINLTKSEQGWQRR